MRILYLLLFVVFIQYSYSLNVLADNDHVSHQVQYAKGINVKLGNEIRTEHFKLGGFFEVRNEKRFDEGYLPNHNWRGFLDFSLLFNGQKSGLINDFLSDNHYLSIGYEHESAHASMGIEESTDDALERIYDGEYRSINLNSLSIKNFYVLSGKKMAFLLKGEYQVYFYSKNTPERSDKKLTQGHGVSAGVDWFYKMFSGYELVVSLHNKYMFNGIGKEGTSIYVDTDTGVGRIAENYPVIRGMNTFEVLSGFRGWSSYLDRHYMLYAKYTRGNKGGFVDSRQKDDLVGFGLMLDVN